MGIDRYRRYIMIGVEIDMYFLDEDKYDMCYKRLYFEKNEGLLTYVRSGHGEVIIVGIPLSAEHGLKDSLEFSEFTSEECAEHAKEVKMHVETEFGETIEPSLFITGRYDK